MSNLNQTVCYVCGKCFSYTRSLNKHLKTIHQIEIKSNFLTLCQEKTCKFSCQKLESLRKHLETVHNIKQDIEEHHFLSWKEFEIWKKTNEEKTRFKWVKHSSTLINDKQLKSCIFYCNRSGKERLISLNNRKRMIKSQGSCKLNRNCTSSMLVKEYNGQVNVIYYKTHYNHDNNLAHVTLPQEAKVMIANQLLQDVPANKIIQKIRETVDEDFKRIHLITSKDINNIAREYNIHDNIIRDSNDAVSVDIWVQEMKSNTDNCVILYKKQGETLNCFKVNDFVLGIMTNCQAELFKKFGNKGIVCMDSTHGTNPYNFYLVTILVVDDFGEGLPVAFLFTNQAKAFMSDDAEQYFAAWSSVMNAQNTQKLLCTWHIDRAWRGKILLIKDKNLQEQIYKTLCVLRLEDDEENFKEYVEKFKYILESSNQLQEFKNYFTVNYLNRCQTWALCYRLGLGINTNMYLEALHKTFKYIYLKGVQCKRLDKTIGILLRFIKDKQFDRVIKLNKGKITHKISLINKRHLTAIKDKELSFQKISDKEWIVQGTTKPYTVRKILENEVHECKLKCKLCCSCIHIYSCCCPDYVIHVNLCKHIHFLCSEYHVEKTTVSPNNDELQLHNSSLKREVDRIIKKKQIVQNMMQNISLKINCEQRYIIVKAHNMLSSLEKLLDSNSNSSSFPINKHTAPHNKKIDPQMRFYSTKKKKIFKNKLGKPTEEERHIIKNNLS